ncbi:DNA repair protein RecN [Chloroflexota bacterium]
MLAELCIENLAVIERLDLKLKPGLTVITGEEGSGKSLIVDALSLIVGARPGDVIRSGAATAKIEGVFWLSGDVMQRVNAVLLENGVEPDAEGTLIISRELREQGRSMARVNGRPAPVSVLQRIGKQLFDLHKQMDQLSLFDGQRQLYLLDSFGGLLELRDQLAGMICELRQKDKEILALGVVDKEQDRELLAYQLEEIEQASLIEGEDEALKQEQELLRNAQSLKEGCFKAYGSLYGDERSAAEMTQQAFTELKGLAETNAVLAGQQEALEKAMVILEEVARELRQYGESVEARASRFEEVEQRLELIALIKRKYGGSIEDTIAYAVNARTRLEALESKEERKALLHEEKQRLEEEAGSLAEQLSQKRCHAANSLIEVVNRELVTLGLPGVMFDIYLSREEDYQGLPVHTGERFAFSKYGIDSMEFLVATNPGEPARPLCKIASGGETCRLMLALKSALKRVDPVPTLVFDEVDMGMGGRSAGVVGAKLADLAKHHQVICITHLPQIACFGDTHYRVVKHEASERAVTRAEILGERSRLEELAVMIGGMGAGDTMFDSAGELLAEAQALRDRETEAIAV